MNPLKSLNRINIIWNLTDDRLFGISYSLGYLWIGFWLLIIEIEIRK